MRPETRKVLLSTTSAAALAMLAGTAIVEKSAWGASNNIVGVLVTDAQTLVGAETLNVNNAGQLNVDAAYAVTITGNLNNVNNGNATSTGFISGTGAGGGAINASTATNTTIINFTNSVIETAVTGNQHAISLVEGVVNNSGVIRNASSTAGLAAINVIGGSNVTISNVTQAATITSTNGMAIRISGGTVVGSISNSGMISTVNGSTFTGAAIELSSALTGGIVNLAGATIQASKNSNGTGGQGIAFLTDNAHANISNSGTIQQIDGGTNGVAIWYNNTDVNSSITNSGSILSSGTGTNSGAIVFGSGGSDVNGSINNQLLGVIRATGKGASAIDFQDNSSLAGGITNAGLIEVNNSGGNDNGVAIKIFQINGNSGGTTPLTITNVEGGTIQGTGNTLGAINIQASSENITINNNFGALIRSNSTNNGANAIFVSGGTMTNTINNSGGTISNIGTGGTNSWTGNAITVSGATVNINNTNGGLITTSATGGETHAISFGSTGDIINDNSTMSNTSTTDAVIIVTNAMTGKIENRNNGLVTNTISKGVAIELTNSVSGGVINSADINGGTNGSFSQYGQNANGIAIKQSDELTNVITNNKSGRIAGSIQLARGTFNILGGIINGETTGQDTALVNFDLDAVTPGSVDVFDITKPNLGFITSSAGDGNILLATGATSLITVNSGALRVSQGDNFQADDIKIDSDAFMVMEGGNTFTLGTGIFENKGFLVFDQGSGNQTITGTLDNKAGSTLGFVLRAGDNFALANTASTLVNGNVRIYNDFSKFTPDNTGSPVTILTTAAGGNLTVLGSKAGNVNADMDTAFNDTVTLHYQASSDGPSQNLVLTVTRTPFGSLLNGFTPNQSAAGNALETIGVNGTTTPGMDAFLGLLDSITSTGQLADALQKTLPIHNGAALYGSMVGFDSMMQSIDSRLANFGGQFAENGRSGLAGAPGVPLNNVWVRGGGGYGTQNTTGGPGGDVAGFTGRTYYGVIGLDREVSEGFRIGGSFAYADSKFDGNGDDVGDSRLKIRSYSGSIYGAWNDMATGMFVTGVVGGGGNHYEGKRTIDITTPAGDFFDIKTSEYNGWQVTGKAIAGWAFGNPMGPTIAPFVSFRYTHLHLNGYTEDGQFDDDLSLTVKSQSYDQALPGVGVRLAAPISSGGMTLLPWIRATYQYDVIGDRQTLSSTFGGDTGTPQTAFETIGGRPGRHVFNAGGGVNVFSGGAFSMSLNYDFEKRNDGFTGHSGFVQARLGF